MNSHSRCQLSNLKSYLDGNVFIIKIKNDFFDIITDIEKSEKIFFLLKVVEKFNKIKAILVLNEEKCFDEIEYNKFLTHNLKKEIDHTSVFEINKFDKDIIRCKEIHILNRIIMALLDSKKMIVSCLQGNIVTPCFGASLASDFRFASENMNFLFSHIKYGLHPSGALPFFLPRYLCQSKAVELLYTGKQINAKHALDLGLINNIFPNNNFEEMCIRKIKSLIKLDINVIKTTKELTFTFKKELSEYFNYEDKIVFDQVKL